MDYSRGLQVSHVVVQSVALCIFIVIVSWVFARRLKQPLKNRTASLILLSLTGNLLQYLFGVIVFVLILVDSEE